MDFSKFKTHDWLVIGGGLGMFIFGLFLDWASIDMGPLGSYSDGNAFDWFRGWLSWLLVIGAAVIVVLRVMGTLKDNLPWPLILIGATGLATLLMLLLVLLGPDKEGVDLGRGIGLWLSFLSTLAALAGAVMGFMAGGGDLNDLRDMNKIKGSFRGADDTPPPPPPPAI